MEGRYLSNFGQAMKRALVPPIDPQAYAPTPERPLRGKVRTLRQQAQIQLHSHPWAQLVFSTEGALHVQAGDSTYIVPPSRAVWVAPDVAHTTGAIEQAALHTIYFAPSLLPGPDWQECRVIEVTPLLRELAQQLDHQSDHQSESAPEPEREKLLSELIVNELRRARTLALGVALPQDARLRRLCEAMLAEPGLHASLEDWAASSGASPRTVSRLFREQLGMSFAQWRSQVVLAHALSMAAKKKSMKVIAAELGYASASAFTAMVTRTMGMPPSQFFARA
jgi:AraC-like DNA-binding protein/quercetin dioxygenase-like cupin family protein